VQWGVVKDVNDDGIEIETCSFSSLPVHFPLWGRFYGRPLTKAEERAWRVKFVTNFGLQTSFKGLDRGPSEREIRINI
jgi:hypothetical protein